MASKIEICNMALANLGAALINQLTEGSPEARYCRLNFDHARDAVLRDHPWNFAARRESLALLSTTPRGFAYAYQYPTDCVRALSIWKSIPTADPIPFEVQAKSGGGKQINTDEADAVLEYTARVTEEGQYDDSFVDALAWRLAAAIAMPLTKSLPIMQAMMTVYENRMAQAAAMDGQEGRKDPEYTSSWIQARL